MSTHNALISRLMAFLTMSPTPFHAVAQMSARLEEAGFTRLEESERWQLVAGGRYYTLRNGASIIAWQMPTSRPAEESGFRMVGAHTDSPCLKVKPEPALYSQGCLQLGVEVYGGVLLSPWFDRDLSLAGRVQYLDRKGELCHTLINFKKPIAIIPSLAIHLDREANEGKKINAQLMLPPVLGQFESKPNFEQLLLQQLEAEGVTASRVLSFDLSFYDTQPPAQVGLHGEFIASARLDNLVSCFMGLEALLGSHSEEGVLLVCNDHEEVGSMSAVGAQGPMLESTLARIAPDIEQRSHLLARSMMISADNAHAIHPNFSDKHDANHGPKMNAGPVIKQNANQRYATTDATSARFRQWAQACGCAVQSFVVRADMGCGSTIGPITAAEIGVKTLDIGIPQLAMHSIRELAGVQDVATTVRILATFMQAKEV